MLLNALLLILGTVLKGSLDHRGKTCYLYALDWILDGAGTVLTSVLYHGLVLVVHDCTMCKLL